MRDKYYNFFLSRRNGIAKLLIPLIIAATLFLSLQHLLSFQAFSHQDISGNYLIGIFCGLILLICIILSPIKYKGMVVMAWLLRMCIVLILVLYFENQYDFLDSFLYYNVAIQSPSYVFLPTNGTVNMSVISSYVFSIIPYSYRASAVIFSFIGIAGLYLFWRAVTKIIRVEDKGLLMLLLFFPSLTFWSTFTGKEAILLFIIGLYLYGVSYWHTNNKQLLGLSMILLSFIGFFFVRVWLVPIFLSAYILSLVTFRKMRKSSLFLLIILGVALISSLIFLLKYFDINSLNSIIIRVHDMAQWWAIGGSSQVLDINSWTTLLIKMPLLMFTTLFRPLIYETHSLFMILAGIENTLLLAAFVFSLLVVIMNKLWKDNFILKFSFFHILMFSIMYAPISYQNLGSAVRFKTQIMPFVLLFIYYSLVNIKKSKMNSLNSINEFRGV